MTSFVVRKASGEMLKLKLVSVVPGVIRGGGVVKLERASITCPACGQQVEAVATDGRVKGYCSVARQHVDFLIETQLAPQSVVRIGNPVTAETRAKLSASVKKLWQNPEYRSKQIAALTGKHPSPETKAKISAAMTRWHKSNEGVVP